MATEPIGRSSTALRGILALIVSLFLLLFFLWLILRFISSFRGSSAPVSSNGSTPNSNLLIETDTEIIVVDTPPLASTGASLDAIIANEAQYLGQTVTLNGYFQQTSLPWGFMLKEDGITTGEMLIVTLKEVTNDAVGAFPLEDTEAGQALEITGTVKRLTRHTSQEFGLDQDDLKALTFDRQLVIEAHEIKSL